jgi:hypothetical protein
MYELVRKWLHLTCSGLMHAEIFPDILRSHMHPIADGHKALCKLNAP